MSFANSRYESLYVYHVGGMANKLTRKKAAEFSFFLAVPTMAGATILDVHDMMNENVDWATSNNLFLLGMVV